MGWGCVDMDGDRRARDGCRVGRGGMAGYKE